MSPKQIDRAIFFVDGNNWYHTLRQAGVTDLGQLNYAKVCTKLIAGRQWVQTRYCVGQVKNEGNTSLYSAQRKYLSWLLARDKRISVYFGRLEPRIQKNKMALELREYLDTLVNRRLKVDPIISKELLALSNRHETTTIVVEKAVDVLIAVDMVEMAQRNEYDTAYLLAADGDYTPAVKAVRAKGKNVIVVSPAYGAALAAEANTFMHLDPDWFKDCFYE